MMKKFEFTFAHSCSSSWNSVAKIMPVEYHSVLVAYVKSFKGCAQGVQVGIAFLANGEWFSTDGWQNKPVSADIQFWAELPDAPSLAQFQI